MLKQVRKLPRLSWTSRGAATAECECHHHMGFDNRDRWGGSRCFGGAPAEADIQKFL